MHDYLPIHAVVASGNQVMYDFMVDICGANPKLEVEELSALKLAVVLGKQAMVKHILKRRLVTAWTWGPVTEYMIPLEEIDTAGSRVIHSPERCLGNLQLLELLVAPHSKRATRKMLEDDFMNGFFFKLINEKWYNNARWWYFANVGFHFFFTFQLTFLAAHSIVDPRLRDPIATQIDGSQLQLAMVVSLILLEEELREIVLWLYVRKQRFTWYQMWHAEKGRGIALSELKSCAVKRRAHVRVPMVLLTLIAAILETHISSLRSEIEAGGSYGPGESDLESQARTLEQWPNICLAFAVFLAWWLLMLDSFQWDEELGVFSAMVNKMLIGDVLSKFLPLFLPILLGFTTSMHAINPQQTTHDSRWSSWWKTFESLVLFSLVGEPPDITPDDIHPWDMFWDRHFRDEFTEGVSRSDFSAGAFVLLYVLFLFIVLLLLINLLIAMMADTYVRETDNARLQWRVLFARLVLRYELLNLPLAMCHPNRHERRVMLGKDGAPSFADTHSPFRSYDKDAQLNLDGEGGDLFADSEGDGNAASAPAAGAAESTEAKREHVEAVAKRTAELVLEKLAPGGHRNPNLNPKPSPSPNPSPNPDPDPDPEPNPDQVPSTPSNGVPSQLTSRIALAPPRAASSPRRCRPLAAPPRRRSSWCRATLPTLVPPRCRRPTHLRWARAAQAR